MSRGDDATQIQSVLRGDLAQMVGPARDIDNGVRPAAAVVADATILDAPHGEAAVRERLLELSRVSNVECREPTTAVDKDDNGIWSGRPRQSEIRELERRRPV